MVNKAGLGEMSFLRAAVPDSAERKKKQKKLELKLEQPRNRKCSKHHSKRYMRPPPLLLLAWVVSLLALPLPPASTPSSDVVERIKMEARQGSFTSRYVLGLYQYYGLGVEADKGAALASFRASAEGFYGPAALAVGMLVDSGEASGGGGGDAAGALAWYQRAGDWGELEGYYRAGMTLYEGRAGEGGGRGQGGASSTSPGGGGRGAREADMAQALHLLQRSATAGFAPAFDALGLMHEYGAHGGPQDFAEAARMYHKGCHWVPSGAAPGGGSAVGGWAAGAAASYGDSPDPEACYHLGLLHAYGRGVPQDFSRAVETLGRASRIGLPAVHAPSALLLGRLYANGQGVPVDYHAALAHFASARSSGDFRVADEAAELYRALDAQVREAEVGLEGALRELKEGLRPPVDL